MPAVTTYSQEIKGRPAGLDIVTRRLFSWADRWRLRAWRRRLPPHQFVGKRGEDIAHRFLQSAGYIVVARNFVTRSKRYEVDLVAWDKDEIAFVEVKTLTDTRFAQPEDRIDVTKMEHLWWAGKEYCRRADIDFTKARVDVVSVVLTEPPSVTLFRDALRDYR